MRERTFHIFASVLAWFLVLVAWSYGLLELRANPEWAGVDLGALAGLMLGAAASARLWAGRVRGASPRLAISFMLAALLLLPNPGGLLVALVAGLAGAATGNVRRYAAMSLAAAIAQAVGSAIAPAMPLPGVVGLVRAALLFVVLQLPALGLAYLLEGGPARTHGASDPVERAALTSEWVTVPLAWLLGTLVVHGWWIQAAVFGTTVVLAQYPLLRLARASGDLHRTHRALASRKTELEILHAVGREILASLEFPRVCSVIERECRKIFDLDYCFVALSDAERGGFDVVYRRRQGAGPDSTAEPMAERLASWIAEEKRGLRVDDLAAPGSRVEIEPVEPGMRSALLVPMVVEDRVIGAVCVQSLRPAAYDDHQLTLLTTVAQQAAVAIESVRHYEKATQDSLTGFFLRDYFFRRLEDEFRRAGRYGGSFSVLMVDLDGFKSINDTHGHIAGDQYLRAIGETIHARLRGADLACRYGGDEFCLLLPETDLHGAQVIAERIREAVSRMIVQAEGATLRSTVSIGLASFPAPGVLTVKDVLRNADEALYQAKRGGRDRVVPFAA